METSKDLASASSSQSSVLKYVNVLLASSIAILFLLDFNGLRWLMPIDEGQWLFYSDQLLRGRVLYLDFWYQFGPVVLYGLAGSMLAVGKSLATERIYFWVLNGLGLASLFAFSGTLSKRLTPRLVLCLVVLLNSLTCRLIMTNPGFLFRQCFNLLPLLLLFRFSSHSEKKTRALGGLCAGVLSMISVLVSQETGLFSFAAAILFLLVMGKENSFGRDFRQQFAFFTSGFGLCLAAWCLFCMVQGSLAGYFVVGFGDIFLMTGKHQSSPLPGLSSITGKSAGLIPLTHFLLSYVPLLVAVVSGLVLLLQDKWDARGIALSGYGICSFSILLGRCDIYHSTFAALSLFLLSLYWVGRQFEAPPKTGKLALFGSVAVLVAFIFVYNGSNIRRLIADSRIMRKATEEEPLAHLGGALIPAWQHKNIVFAKRTIEENTLADQPIFVLRHAPHYYFFTDRPARTRFATPIFANSEAAKREVMLDLENNRYDYLIYESSRFPDVDYDYYFKEILAYVNDHYVVHSGIESKVHVLELKEYK